MCPVRVGMLTREWPPDMYGGAGVHVEFLTRELASIVEISLQAFAMHGTWDRLGGADVNAALRVLATDLSIAAAVGDCDLVHSHTWYANLAGHLAKLLYGIPHVLTAHSLEPLRPWKAEQLGGGYAVSSWAERVAIESADAVIAVSNGMHADVLTAYPAVDPSRIHVVHNGIDTEVFTPRPDPDALSSLGLDPWAPTVVYVGRITRQKGLPDLLRAVALLPEGVQVVLCASAPDTPEIAAEVETAVARLQATRTGVVWVREHVPRDQLVAIVSSGTVFTCPSVYEPLGIVNLEAMACGVPVVATNVGGIPEVVVDGETGLLVPPGDPERFAAAIARLAADRDTAATMGRAGRKRVVEEFGWDRIARRVVEVYESVTA